MRGDLLQHLFFFSVCICRWGGGDLLQHLFFFRVCACRWGAANLLQYLVFFRVCVCRWGAGNLLQHLFFFFEGPKSVAASAVPPWQAWQAGCCRQNAGECFRVWGLIPQTLCMGLLLTTEGRQTCALQTADVAAVLMAWWGLIPPSG